MDKHHVVIMMSVILLYNMRTTNVVPHSLQSEAAGYRYIYSLHSPK